MVSSNFHFPLHKQITVEAELKLMGKKNVTPVKWHFVGQESKSPFRVLGALKEVISSHTSDHFIPREFYVRSGSLTMQAGQLGSS